MRMGLGLGLTSLRGGGGLPTPASLFDAWFEPGTECYVERTGASATTAAVVGDPVGTIRSTDGVLNLVALADAARPILRQTLSGSHYLEGDTGDLLVAQGWSPSGITEMTLYAAAEIEGGTDGGPGFLGVVEDATATNSPPHINLRGRLDQWAAVGMAKMVILDSGVANSIAAVYGVIAGDTYDDVVLRTNGAVVSSTEPATTYTYTSGYDLAIFGIWGGGLTRTRRFYGGGVALRKLTTQEAEETEAYLSALSGIAI